MKTFQSMRSGFASLGISPRSSHQKYPFNAKMLMVYLCYWTGIALHWAYISQNAHSFEEYSNLVFGISLLSFNTACYTVYAIKVDNLNEACLLCEKIVDRSKWIEVNLNHIQFWSIKFAPLTNKWLVSIFKTI